MNGGQNGAMRSVHKEARVLAIGLGAEELGEVAAILEPHGYELMGRGDCADAWRVLHRERVEVVLLEDRLPDTSWQEALHEFTNMANAPAVIVTSRFADESLWVEVLSAGGFDVLEKPIHGGELLRVMAHACPAPFQKRAPRRRVRVPAALPRLSVCPEMPA